MKKRPTPSPIPAHVRPDALEAARELTAKIASPEGRRLSYDVKGRMLLAACQRHGCSVTEIAEALDFLASEIRRAAGL